MSCDTYYRKIITKGKENCQNFLSGSLEQNRKCSWWDAELEELYPMKLKAIDALDVNMTENFMDLIDEHFYFNNDEPVIYETATEFDINQPRLGGYPPQRIRSADEMFKAMETGLVNEKGKLYHFFINETKENYVRNNIIEFFKKYPDGFIEFT